MMTAAFLQASSICLCGVGSLCLHCPWLKRHPSFVVHSPAGPVSELDQMLKPSARAANFIGSGIGRESIDFPGVTI
jgi:hypothetical protein